MGNYIDVGFEEHSTFKCSVHLWTKSLTIIFKDNFLILKSCNQFSIQEEIIEPSFGNTIY